MERTTEAAGQRVGTLMAEGQTFGPNTVWPWHCDATGTTCGDLSVDAPGVGQPGPGGAQAEGRMVHGGMVFHPVPQDVEGSVPQPRSRSLAGLLSLEEVDRLDRWG